MRVSIDVLGCFLGRCAQAASFSLQFIIAGVLGILTKSKENVLFF